MTSRVVHRPLNRANVDLRAERLAGNKVRIGVWRRPPASSSPEDFVLSTSATFSLGDARGIASALGALVDDLARDAA